MLLLCPHALSTSLDLSLRLARLGDAGGAMAEVQRALDGESKSAVAAPRESTRPTFPHDGEPTGEGDPPAQLVLRRFLDLVASQPDKVGGEACD